MAESSEAPILEDSRVGDVMRSMHNAATVSPWTGIWLPWNPSGHKLQDVPPDRCPPVRAPGKLVGHGNDLVILYVVLPSQGGCPLCQDNSIENVTLKC